MMDPLSDVLSLLDVRFVRCKRLEAAGDWSLHFPAKAALKFAAVLVGECWIRVEGQAPRLLRDGDTFLLANAPGYDLASAPNLEPQDGSAVYDGGSANMARINGSDTVVIGGEFVFGKGNAQLLLDALPNLVLVAAASPESAVLRDTLVLLDREIKDSAIGRSLMMRRLADIALIQVLRAHVAQAGPRHAKWVGALSDARIAAALACIHNEPGKAWTVAELAKCAGMSRSGFAFRFKDLVGSPPLDYLMRWRMELARDALRQSDVSLRRIALDAGYASESAFGFAFKKLFGCAPRQYWVQNSTELTEA